MMESILETTFLVKLALTFIFGSAWITYSTIIAEKFGSKLGGVIGGMPSTIVIGLFFIGWTQTAEVAASATVATPIVMGFSAILIAIYALILRRGFFLALTIALVSWFLLATSLLVLQLNSFVISVFGLIFCLLISYLVFEYYLKIKSVGGKPYKLFMKDLLFRGIASGSIITLAVLVAKIGGPLVGGIFASFPAVFLSNIIISYRSRGAEFSLSLMKILMISGTINATVYATAVRFFYPSFGLFIGTTLSFLISMVSTYLIFRLAKKIS